MVFDELFHLPDEDILEWWHEQRLPHPGCPESFKMVIFLTRVCHRVCFTSEGSTQLLTNRKQGLKETLGNVLYSGSKQIRLKTKDGDEELDDLLFCVEFYFPYKAKHILVPLSNNKAQWADLELIGLLYQ